MPKPGRSRHGLGEQFARGSGRSHPRLPRAGRQRRRRPPPSAPPTRGLQPGVDPLAEQRAFLPGQLPASAHGPAVPRRIIRGIQVEFGAPADPTRLGDSLAPYRHMKLDPVALAGRLATGAAGVLLPARMAVRRPDASIAELLADPFRTPMGRTVRAHGAWVRRSRLRKLYLRQDARFPDHRPGVTRRRAGVARSRWTDRRTSSPRSACDPWIERGGDPRFRHGPPVADPRALAGAFR